MEISIDKSGLTIRLKIDEPGLVKDISVIGGDTAPIQLWAEPTAGRTRPWVLASRLLEKPLRFPTFRWFLDDRFRLRSRGDAIGVACTAIAELVDVHGRLTVETSRLSKRRDALRQALREFENDFGARELLNELRPLLRWRGYVVRPDLLAIEEAGDCTAYREAREVCMDAAACGERPEFPAAPALTLKALESAESRAFFKASESMDYSALIEEELSEHHDHRL
jgi:hypothetical protein